MSLEHGNKPLTLSNVLRQGAESLRQAGVEEADADAELLLLYLLGISKTEMLRDWRDSFPETKLEAWNGLLARKKAGEPVQYMIGEQYFYGRAFEVTASVLIPRPETELLAEAVLEIADRLWPESQADALTTMGTRDRIRPAVLDVGTGSGILAITLAAERPKWRVAASDLSADALEVARRNAERHGVANRIAFFQGDLLTPFLVSSDSDACRMVIDILISNPPYIPSSDIPSLQREVRDHEPRLALDGGEDGLNPYRVMASQFRGLAQLPRVVAWEVGMGQAADIANLLHASADWNEIRFVKDYAGIDRHVLAVK